MKRILFTLFILFITHFAIGQRDHKRGMPEATIDKPVKAGFCDSIVVDIEKGTVNGKIMISSPLDTIKKYFPCVTKVVQLNEDEAGCEGGIFLEKQGVVFNPDKGFIEFTPKTTARLPINVFGMSEDSLNENMSGLVQISDINSVSHDSPTHSVYLYPKTYGSLAIWVEISKKEVMKIQIHNKNFAKAFLCIE